MLSLAHDRLLIADPFLKEDDFLRTVIYLMNHDQEGSFGLILNRPFDYALHELMNDVEVMDIKVNVGGPVGLDSIHFIHQYPDLIPDSQRMQDDICWGGDFNVLKQLINKKEIDLNKIRFFIGYSGWGAGQLEQEMHENTWLLGASDKKIIFETKAEEVWKAAIRSLGKAYAELLNYPIDPQLN